MVATVVFPLVFLIAWIPTWLATAGALLAANRFGYAVTWRLVLAGFIVGIFLDALLWVSSPRYPAISLATIPVLLHLSIIYGAFGAMTSGIWLYKNGAPAPLQTTVGLVLMLFGFSIPYKPWVPAETRMETVAQQCEQLPLPGSIEVTELKGLRIGPRVFESDDGVAWKFVADALFNGGYQYIEMEQYAKSNFRRAEEFDEFAYVGKDKLVRYTVSNDNNSSCAQYKSYRSGLPGRLEMQEIAAPTDKCIGMELVDATGAEVRVDRIDRWSRPSRGTKLHVAHFTAVDRDGRRVIGEWDRKELSSSEGAHFFSCLRDMQGISIQSLLRPKMSGAPSRTFRLDLGSGKFPKSEVLQVEEVPMSQTLKMNFDDNGIRQSVRQESSGVSVQRGWKRNPPYVTPGGTLLISNSRLLARTRIDSSRGPPIIHSSPYVDAEYIHLAGFLESKNHPPALVILKYSLQGEPVAEHFVDLDNVTKGHSFTVTPDGILVEPSTLGYRLLLDISGTDIGRIQKVFVAESGK